MTLGDPSRRGCADGAADALMFWFPRCENFDGALTYSRPLIPSPHGAVFVHTGGVLMRLSEDLSSATKVSSMRQELWLLDNDEGTPEYPTSCNVFGVHDEKVYKALVRTDYRGERLVRRLQISADLRQSRSQIRKAAQLWPSINEERLLAQREYGRSLVPEHHHEARLRKKLVEVPGAIL